VLLLSLPLPPLLYYQLKDDTPPDGALAISLLVVAFISSCLWTDLLANELVAGLDFIGLALGISRSILGLTVLAWGNSIGDLVADTALARAGNPRMGAAGCFGGPLFNLLIGTGVSLSYYTLTRGDFCFQYSKEVPVGFLFLVGSLLITGITLPMNRFHFSKRVGIVLIAYYVFFLISSLLVQTLGRGKVGDPLGISGHAWFGTSCPTPKKFV